mgnify:CR=1 FL=1
MAPVHLGFAVGVQNRCRAGVRDNICLAMMHQRLPAQGHLHQIKGLQRARINQHITAVGHVIERGRTTRNMVVPHAHAFTAAAQLKLVVTKLLRNRASGLLYRLGAKPLVACEIFV